MQMRKSLAVVAIAGLLGVTACVSIKGSGGSLDIQGSAGGGQGGAGTSGVGGGQTGAGTSGAGGGQGGAGTTGAGGGQGGAGTTGAGGGADAGTCASPVVVDLQSLMNGMVAIGYGDNVGKPSAYKASCSPQDGAEFFWQFTAPTTGVVTIMLFGVGDGDYTLSARAACADDATEILCANYQQTLTLWEDIAFQVTQGTTYYVMVEGADPQTSGYFNAEFKYAPTENLCYDLADNDNDGLLDCEDPECQSTDVCNPGPGLVGVPCTFPGDCGANAKDPTCLRENKGWPGGYCSEFCSVAKQDCGGDAVCVQLGISQAGVCLDGCVSDADCRAGYSCQNVGGALMACKSL